MLVVTSWSCWTNTNATKANSMVYLLAYINLDTCDASLKNAILGTWMNLWLNLVVFYVCASTLFMRETICRSFSLIVLVSLTMAWVISTNCFSMNVVYVTIIGVVTDKEEVKKLTWLEGLSSEYGDWSLCFRSYDFRNEINCKVEMKFLGENGLKIKNKNVQRQKRDL